MHLDALETSMVHQLVLTPNSMPPAACTSVVLHSLAECLSTLQSNKKVVRAITFASSPHHSLHTCCAHSWVVREVISHKDIGNLTSSARTEMSMTGPQCADLHETLYESCVQRPIRRPVSSPTTLTGPSGSMDALLSAMSV